MLEISVMVDLLGADYSAELGCKPQYLWYVSLGLLVWRNAAILLDCAGTRVVGSQRQALVAVELLEQTTQEFGAPIQALLHVERIADAQAASGSVHQLGEAFGANPRLGFGIEVRFGLDEARQECWLNAVLVR